MSNKFVPEHESVTSFSLMGPESGGMCIVDTNDGKITRMHPYHYDTEYTDDKLPTCETAGEKSRHCRVCGARTDVTEIPAAEHKWEAGDVLIPSCTGEGKQQ